MLPYQVVHWPSVPVRTNEHAVIVWKTTGNTANKTRELAGRNGHKLTKARINLTNVDFPYVIQKVTELCVSQLRCQLKTVIVVISLVSVSTIFCLVS